MLLDVAWPEIFELLTPEDDGADDAQRSGTRIDRRRMRAPADLGEVTVTLDLYPDRAAEPALFEPWQRDGREATEVRVRTLVCRHGRGSSAVLEIPGTDQLTATYAVEVAQHLVTLRTGPASAVVLGAAMTELDEICRTLNLRAG